MVAARDKAARDTKSRVETLRMMGVREIPTNRFEQKLLLTKVASTHPLDIQMGQRFREAFLTERKVAHDEKLARKVPARDRVLGTEIFTAGEDRSKVVKISNPEMPAFAKLVQKLGGRKTLAGWKVIGIQHLLGSTGGLARALTASGARAEDTMLLGKTYSQVDAVMDDLKADGFDIRSARAEADLATGFGNGAHNREVELRGAIDEIIGVGTDSGHPKPMDLQHRYLVVDDGGELLEMINREYPQLHGRIVGVEQTTRGIRKLEKLDLKFPVITVGDAVEKTVHESPMIGRSLALTGHARLERIEKQGFSLGKDILVIGAAGAVGRETAKAYQALGYHVRVFDKRTAELRQLAAEHGYTVEGSLDEALARSKIVLSLTGTQTIGERELELLPAGAVLMNGASSATEIARVKENGSSLDDMYDRQVRDFQGKPFDIGGLRPMIGLRSQQDIIMKTRGGKQLLLVNQGQVINFDNSVDPIPPRYIQLTRGLLYMAAIQAAGATKPGTQKLDPAAARAYRETVEHDLARTHESLQNPTF
ncbi:MAG: NAD(P)-dependent oxidoreductase [Polyangia bacterium]